MSNISIQEIGQKALTLKNSKEHILWDEDRKYIIKDAIGVQCYGSSGTLLLKSLLDGNTELLTCPGILNMDLYGVLNRLKKLSSEERCKISIHQTFLQACGIPIEGSKKIELAFNHGLDKLGENKDLRIGCKEEDFKLILARVLISTYNKKKDISTAELYLIYILSYKIVSDIEINKNKETVLKFVWDIHSNDRENVEEFKNHFTNVKIIHMWRDPISLIDSLYKHIHSVVTFNDQEAKYGLRGITHKILDQIFLEIMWVNNSEKLIPFKKYARMKFPFAVKNQSKYIWLEELHQNPKDILEKLCIWLDIKWDDKLLKSTFEGKKFWNRNGSEDFSGFNPEFALKKSKLLSKDDEIILKYIANQCFKNERYKVNFYEFIIRFFNRLEIEKNEYILFGELYVVYKKLFREKISSEKEDEETLALILLEYLAKKNIEHLKSRVNIEFKDYKGRLIRKWDGTFVSSPDFNINECKIALEINPNAINLKQKIKVTTAFYVLKILKYIKIRILIFKCIILNRLQKNDDIYPESLI
jgi:hypothetical protein